MGVIIKNSVMYNSSNILNYPVCYSEEERKIGCWTDGKPLYQKTINFGALPSSGEKSVTHNILNLDRIVSCISIAKNSNNIFLQIPYVNAGNDRVGTYVTNTNITIGVSTNLSAYTDTQVTIQYTKTTDTPGSGIYTPSGVPAQHYSTNEQVVGTWIDGSTMYEKTVVVNSGFSASMTVNHGIANIDKIIGVEGIVETSYPAWLPLTDNVPVSGYNVTVEGYNRTSFSVYIGSSRVANVAAIYITIRYTKST